MQATRVVWALLLVAAAAAQENPLPADDVARLSGRVAADAPAVGPVGRRRLTRLRSSRPARRRLAPEPEELQFASAPSGGTDVAPIDVASIAPTAPTAAAGRGRARGAGRRRGSRRRVSRVRGVATTKTPSGMTASALLADSQDTPRQDTPRTRSQQTQQSDIPRFQAQPPADSQDTPKTAVGGRQGGRASGRAGSRFNLQTYLEEKSRVSTGDVSTTGLPELAAAVSGPARARARAPTAAPAPAQDNSEVSAPAPATSRPSRRRGGRFRTSSTQLAVLKPTLAPRRRVHVSPPASTEETLEPETQRTILQEPEQVLPAPEAPARGVGRRQRKPSDTGSRAGSRTRSRGGSWNGSRTGSESGSQTGSGTGSGTESQTGSRVKNTLGRRGSRKRVRVTSSTRLPPPETVVTRPEQQKISPNVGRQQTTPNVARLQTSPNVGPIMEIPSLLAAFLHPSLAPHGASEGFSPSQANGIAGDFVGQLPVPLADEFIGGREGRSYLPEPGAQSLNVPRFQSPQQSAGTAYQNAYFPGPDAKPSFRQKSYLPTSNEGPFAEPDAKPSFRQKSYLPSSDALPNRSRKPSYLPEPDSLGPSRPSLFDGLALPPVGEARPKPEPAAAAAECSADPGAIRLELRFLRPCDTDADCGRNLACFTAAAPCPGAAPQESVCLPAMLTGAACSRSAHCDSAQCLDNVCL